jgi:hypothetical protein
MEAIEFACVLHEITKNLKVDMDADLVGKIFGMYEGSYENYTLLELIGLLHTLKIPIQCAWNKKAIIDMIESKKLDVPKKYEEMQATKWDYYRVRRSLDIISTKYMEFSEGNVIKNAHGAVFLVEAYITQELTSDDLPEDDPCSWEDVAYIILENQETQEECQIHPDEFFNALDNDDVTILQDTSRGYYASEEMKQKWMNHVRMM